MAFIGVIGRRKARRIVVLHLLDGFDFGVALGFLQVEFILLFLCIGLSFQSLLLALQALNDDLDVLCPKLQCRDVVRCLLGLHGPFGIGTVFFGLSDFFVDAVQFAHELLDSRQGIGVITHQCRNRDEPGRTGRTEGFRQVVADDRRDILIEVIVDVNRMGRGDVRHALSIVTVPFSAWHFSKFITEGTMGHLVSATLKLLIVSIMIGLCVTCIKDSKPGDIFTQSTPGVSQQGSGQAVTGPADYVAWATADAEKYEIPVNLFLGMIQHESSWNPNAVSPYGAEGLGQLMPGTAEGLGCDNPFDPESNLEASAKYLKQMYDKFGDWDYALAAYNGGPNSISPGEPLPSWAIEYINAVKGQVVGSYVAHNSITSEQLSKYIRMCFALLGLVFLTLRVPRTIMRQMGGPIEIR